MAKFNIFFTIVAFLVAFLALQQRYMDNTFWFLNLFHYHNFSFEEIPNMHGKVILITGANAGLGYVSTLELARRGARVIMACRSEKRAIAAMDRIKEQLENADLDFVQLDLGDYRSTANAVATIKEKYEKLDVILANAGVEDPNFLRLNGMERPMRINHIGHFQLVTGLEEQILAAINPRVVVLSSNAHRHALNVFDDSWNRVVHKSDYWSPMRVFYTYGRSKLANILFARELQSRFNKRNLTVFVNSAHPGAVQTGMASRMYTAFNDQYFAGLLRRWYDFLSDLAIYSVDDGALTQLYLASSPEVVEKDFRGEYFIPHGVKTAPSNWAMDTINQKKLWTWSEEKLERLSDDCVGS